MQEEIATKNRKWKHLLFKINSVTGFVQSRLKFISVLTKLDTLQAIVSSTYKSKKHIKKLKKKSFLKVIKKFIPEYK